MTTMKFPAIPASLIGLALNECLMISKTLPYQSARDNRADGLASENFQQSLDHWIS